MEEKEVKFLEIDKEAIETKLNKIGAKRVFEKKYRRKVYDFPDRGLDGRGAWVRVRDEGDEVTLSFKQRLGVKTHDGKTDDESMEEVQVITSDFEKTALILEKIGLELKHYAENKRIRYLLGDIEFDIDSWPQIPPYLEIEAPSWEKVEEGMRILELNPAEKRIFSTNQIYHLYGISVDDYRVITFEEMVKYHE